MEQPIPIRTLILTNTNTILTGNLLTATNIMASIHTAVISPKSKN